MTGDPPFDVGAVQEIVAWALPDVAVTFVGGDGASIIFGITWLLGALAKEAPTRLTAFTVNEYAVPLMRPWT